MSSGSLTTSAPIFYTSAHSMAVLMQRPSGQSWGQETGLDGPLCRSVSTCLCSFVLLISFGCTYLLFLKKHWPWAKLVDSLIAKMQYKNMNSLRLRPAAEQPPASGIHKKGIFLCREHWPGSQTVPMRANDVTSLLRLCHHQVSFLLMPPFSESNL